VLRLARGFAPSQIGAFLRALRGVPGLAHAIERRD
jgi:hypothetical protein